VNARAPLTRLPAPDGLNRLARGLWKVAWLLLFRPSPTPLFAWRNWLLRLFGAKVAPGAHVYPSAQIWAPWNLELGKGACLAPEVDCYNVMPVILGSGSTVSQYSYLCTASHDLEAESRPLLAGPIFIDDGAWVAADVFIGPGVKVGEGAVVGARSSVFRDLPAGCVAGGNPAKELRRNPGREGEEA
jgi:putative colanic acid biosynthesis acetyltransferase WcaF